MAALARSPTSVLAATAARSMSPVDRCTSPSASAISGACVPLPAPGGPNSITISREPLFFFPFFLAPPSTEASANPAAAPAAHARAMVVVLEEDMVAL